VVQKSDSSEKTRLSQKSWAGTRECRLIPGLKSGIMKIQRPVAKAGG
jgi:hypothetical protein